MIPKCYRMLFDKEEDNSMVRSEADKDRLIKHIVNFLDVEYPNQTLSHTEFSSDAELLCILKGTAVYRTYQHFRGTPTTGLYIFVVGISDSDMERICIIHNYNVKQRGV